MTVELLRGGTFQLEEIEVKSAIYDESLQGIVIETIKGVKITIKDDENNRKLWLSK
jgi:hypothetical protein